MEDKIIDVELTLEEKLDELVEEFDLEEVDAVQTVSKY